MKVVNYCQVFVIVRIANVVSPVTTCSGETQVLRFSVSSDRVGDLIRLRLKNKRSNCRSASLYSVTGGRPSVK